MIVKKWSLMDSRIILIGGASGCAKTSTSKDISFDLNITHRIGSGFVREMAKNFQKRMKIRPYTSILLCQ